MKRTVGLAGVFMLLVLMVIAYACSSGGGGGDDTPAPAAATYNVVDYRPLEQGDTWTTLISHGTATVNYIETISGTENINSVAAIKLINQWGDYQLMTNSNGITNYKYYDDDNLADCGWSQMVYTPPISFGVAGMSIGTKYTSSFTTNYSNCRSETNTASSSSEVTIEAVEDVTVPAGTFKDCLKTKQTFNSVFTDEGQLMSYVFTASLRRILSQIFPKSTLEKPPGKTRGFSNSLLKKSFLTSS